MSILYARLKRPLSSLDYIPTCTLSIKIFSVCRIHRLIYFIDLFYRSVWVFYTRKEQNPLWRLSDFNVKTTLATDVCTPVMLSYTSVEPRCEKKKDFVTSNRKYTNKTAHLRSLVSAFDFRSLAYVYYSQTSNIQKFKAWLKVTRSRSQKTCFLALVLCYVYLSIKAKRQLH